MFTWLAACAIRTGTSRFFNDWLRDRLRPAQARCLCATLGLRINAPQTRNSPAGTGAVLCPDSAATGEIIRCGTRRADYIPGHAHADTLSFEASLGTCRVLSIRASRHTTWGRGGLATFDGGAQYRRDRREDSSEMWSHVSCRAEGQSLHSGG